MPDLVGGGYAGSEGGAHTGPSGGAYAGPGAPCYPRPDGQPFDKMEPPIALMPEVIRDWDAAPSAPHPNDPGDHSTLR